MQIVRGWCYTRNNLILVFLPHAIWHTHGYCTVYHQFFKTKCLFPYELKDYSTRRSVKIEIPNVFNLQISRRIKAAYSSKVKERTYIEAVDLFQMNKLNFRWEPFWRKSDFRSKPIKIKCHALRFNTDISKHWFPKRNRRLLRVHIIYKMFAYRTVQRHLG